KGRISVLANKLIQAGNPPSMVVGVSRGGIVPGLLLRNCLSSHYPTGFKVVDPFTEGALKQFAGTRIVLVDDIYDSGATSHFFTELAMLHEVRMLQFFILDKREMAEEERALWYVFPWETAQDEAGGRQQATATLLRSLGEDPLREGLKDTPKRVDKMWDELAAGYGQRPKEILKTTFAAGEYDEMIILKDIEFFSTCEHHMLPFYGKVHFGYLPDKGLVGISKVARLVECFSRRLQIQERM
ncbi:unnamed protein product, partial [marine sediment metagenome]